MVSAKKCIFVSEAIYSSLTRHILWSVFMRGILLLVRKIEQTFLKASHAIGKGFYTFYHNCYPILLGLGFHIRIILHCILLVFFTSCSIFFFFSKDFLGQEYTPQIFDTFSFGEVMKVDIPTVVQ